MPDARVARVADMRTGMGTRPGTRVFVLDLSGDTGTDATVELASSAGTLALGYSGPNPETGGWRISLDFDPAGAVPRRPALPSDARPAHTVRNLGASLGGLNDRHHRQATRPDGSCSGNPSLGAV